MQQSVRCSRRFHIKLSNYFRYYRT